MQASTPDHLQGRKERMKNKRKQDGKTCEGERNAEGEGRDTQEDQTLSETTSSHRHI